MDGFPEFSNISRDIGSEERVQDGPERERMSLRPHRTVWNQLGQCGARNLPVVKRGKLSQEATERAAS